MRDQAASVCIEGDRIVQPFGSKGHRSLPPKKRDHYMYRQGGRLSFCKATMLGAGLEIIDATPKDSFASFLARYDKQLTAESELGRHHTSSDH